MKKLFSYVLVIVALFALVGCGEEKTPAEGTHTHTVCETCGKCTDATCTGTAEEKCQGHSGEAHSHVVCPICGKCTDAACPGAEEEKCQGHVTHSHTVCETCGKCTDPACPGTTEEKCQGHGGTLIESNYRVATMAELTSADAVNVKFRVPFGTSIQAQINVFIEEFEALYPNVNIELDVVSGYDEMKKATIEDINGGDAPTMSVGYPDHFAEYLITNSIITLDNFIYDENVGYSRQELADFVSGYISENTQFDAGSYVGLPFNKSTEALYYNVEFFEEFDLEVPTTWAEFETVCEQIMTIVSTIEDGQYSFLGNIKTNLQNNEFVPLMYDSGGNLFTTISHQFGGEYTASEYKSNGLVDVQRGKILFDGSAKTLEGLTYFQGLAQKGYFNMPDSMELQYGSYAFVEAKCLMNIGSTGGSSYYSDSICTLGVTTVPYYDAEHKDVIQQGTNVCIFEQADDLEKLAAWLFIKYMLEPVNTARFAVTTGYMPVRTSAYALPVYTDFLGGRTPAAAVHNATAKYATGGWNYFVDAAWAGSSNVRTECETAISTILIDQADIATELAAAVNRIG